MSECGMWVRGKEVRKSRKRWEMMWLHNFSEHDFDAQVICNTTPYELQRSNE
jgi:hypothetical protein